MPGEYKSPAKYDDMIRVSTELQEIGPASVQFAHKIFCGEKLLASGHTRHPLVNKQMKPVRMPDEIKIKLEGKNG